MKTSKLFSLIALLSVLYFLFAAIFLHFVRTDLDPVVTVLSVYALNEAGMILRAAFLLIGLAEIILSFLISKTIKRERNLGRWLLCIAGIGVCIVAINKWGEIHNIGALLQFTFFPPAVLLIGVKQKKRIEKTMSFAIGVISLTLTVLMISIGFGDPFGMVGISGLIQKTNICAIWLWLCLSSFRVYLSTEGDHECVH